VGQLCCYLFGRGVAVNKNKGPFGIRRADEFAQDVGLVALLAWKPQTDPNIINLIIGGLGLTFLAIGSIFHERRRR
jgi:hypothetical protein